MIVWALEFFLVLVVALGLIRVAPRLGLLAHPGEHRHHQIATPVVGGIAIFIGIAVAAWLSNSEFQGWLPVLLLICVVGVLDDLFHLPSWSRLVVQSLAAWLMIQVTGIQLETLGKIFGEQELWLGRWAVPLTIFATVGVINAMNMSDGMDGLAGTLTIIIAVAIILVSDGQSGFLALLIVALLAFLCLNLRIGRPRALVFMGDAGSTMLGLILAFALMSLSQPPTALAPAVTALWLLGLPLIDAVAVLLIRPLSGQSPFSADRIHYHHLLMDKGLSVDQTLLAACSIQTLLIAAGIWMWSNSVDQTTQFALFLGLFVAYLGYLWSAIKR